LSAGSDFDIQVDFSGGQINQSSRRRNDVNIVKAGGQVCQNWRCTATGQLIPRSGRNLLYYTNTTRGDYVRVSTGEEFLIRFSAHRLEFVDLIGTVIAFVDDPKVLLWDARHINNINFAQAQDNIYICYPTMRPYMCVWDRQTRKWDFYQFSFDQGSGAIKMPFYRRAVLGAAMSYDGLTGDINLTCSKNYFTPNLVGAIISILGQQVTIKEYKAPNKVVATVTYRLPESIAVAVKDIAPFIPGQIVQLAASGVKFEVGSVKSLPDKDNPNAGTVVGVLISNIIFEQAAYQQNDQLVSPLGASAQTNLPGKADPGSPTIQWQEEFFSSRQGYPESVSYDRGRLIFTAFPQATNAILWSQIGSPNSFWIDTVASSTQPGAGGNADSAIFELVSGSQDIFFVQGWQQGQFVFTRRGVYYIPASQQYPVQPGNVTFERISDDGIANVRPITLNDAMLFINSELNRIAAVRPTGSYTRPFLTQDVSDMHTDLFTSPVHITVTTGDGFRPERMVYVVNKDGTVVVGKAAFGSEGQPLFIGWSPWVSNGTVTWLSARGPSVFYTTVYNYGDVAYAVCETGTEQVYLDHTLLVNGDNGKATPPEGKGIFYQAPAGTMVTVMDFNLDYGEHAIDENGFIIPYPGEDLSSPTLVAGFYTPSIYRPFSYFDRKGDRTKRISVDRISINVEQATDFMLGNKVFTTSAFEVDGTAQPKLLDGTFRIRTLGRSWNQSVDVIKHRPGPITVCELSLEVSN